MTEATVHKTRHFFPAEMFLHSAGHFVRKVITDDPPQWPDLMAAASLLALSLEALVNSLGPQLLDDFSDFESASPVAKLRLINESVGLGFDKSQQPISDIRELARLRNKMAHPKYKKLQYSSERLLLREAQRLLSDESKTLHDLEKAITPESVDKWHKAVVSVTRDLVENIEPDLQKGFSKSWLEIHE
ncbi:hypothetical protein ACGTNG_05235 [Halomonas sp. 1390]|uniref:hypothetical protein n=1 Tax=Halomonas sp. B23F22_3 TaxID=3459516 RepID=UPI00373E2DBA